MFRVQLLVLFMLKISQLESSMNKSNKILVTFFFTTKKFHVYRPHHRVVLVQLQVVPVEAVI